MLSKGDIVKVLLRYEESPPRVVVAGVFAQDTVIPEHLLTGTYNVIGCFVDIPNKIPVGITINPEEEVKKNESHTNKLNDDNPTG
jgi:hypothetical protein